MTNEPDTPETRTFPTAAGILFGLGLGGFFDGIILHQLLQWHHILSNWYPINSIENLELNTFWDGIFHSSTYIFVVAGLFILWRHAHRRHLYWSNRLLIGTILIGFGVFNVVEGLIDHQILGVHHVNELVAVENRNLLGYRLLGVGCGDVHHRLDAHALRQRGHACTATYSSLTWNGLADTLERLMAPSLSGAVSAY